MEIRPLKSYCLPRYPTRPEADLNPALLRRLPKRWQGNAVLLAVLAGAGLATLSDGQAGAVDKAKIVARLAPLFPLGIERPRLEGDRPAPVYLTEEDARAIIVEEAKKAGINFAPDALVVEKVRVPTEMNRWSKDKDTQQLDLTLDGTDAERKISYEFVSAADAQKWNTGKTPYTEYETLTAAMALRGGLMQKLPEGTTVLFYDCGYHQKDANQEDLRQQVRDFITWLKAEGVI